MIPTLSTAAIVFVLAFLAAPAVDLDGTGRAISGALLDGNNLITAAVVPSSGAAVGLHFLPDLGSGFFGRMADQWWTVSADSAAFHYWHHQLSGSGMGIELSPGHATMDFPGVYGSGGGGGVGAADLPGGSGQLFVRVMPLGISGTFTFMLQFQAESQHSGQPFSPAWRNRGFFWRLIALRRPRVAGNFGPDSPPCRGIAPGIAIPGGRGAIAPTALTTFRPISKSCSGGGSVSKSSRSLHFFPWQRYRWQVSGRRQWGVDMAAFGFDQFSLNPSGGYLQKKTVVPTWADIVTQANLGIQALEETRETTFPSLLEASAECEGGGSISWTDCGDG